MWIVRKIEIDGIEYLPDIVDTDMFGEWELAQGQETRTRDITLAAEFYIALAKRENFYQNNTPSPFGDPEYSMYCGVVNGFLQGSRMTMGEDAEYFIVKRGRRSILKVEKILRNPWFYTAKKENSEILSDIFE